MAMALHLAQHRVFARTRARMCMRLVRSGPISKGKKSSASVERRCHQVTSNAFFKPESRLIEPTLTGFLKCTKTEKPTPNSTVHHRNPVPRNISFSGTLPRTPTPRVGATTEHTDLAKNSTATDATGKAAHEWAAITVTTD